MFNSFIFLVDMLRNIFEIVFRVRFFNTYGNVIVIVRRLEVIIFLKRI